MQKQTQQPGPGRSTASTTFDDLRKEIARRNDQASDRARKLRAVRDREQVALRRQRDAV